VSQRVQAAARGARSFLLEVVRDQRARQRLLLTREQPARTPHKHDSTSPVIARPIDSIDSFMPAPILRDFGATPFAAQPAAGRPVESRPFGV
jgi:hypothetical protein